MQKKKKKKNAEVMKTIKMVYIRFSLKCSSFKCTWNTTVQLI